MCVCIYVCMYVCMYSQLGKMKIINTQPRNCNITNNLYIHPCIPVLTQIHTYVLILLSELTTFLRPLGFPVPYIIKLYTCLKNILFIFIFLIPWDSFLLLFKILRFVLTTAFSCSSLNLFFSEVRGEGGHQLGSLSFHSFIYYSFNRYLLNTFLNIYQDLPQSHGLEFGCCCCKVFNCKLEIFKYKTIAIMHTHLFHLLYNFW